MPPSQLTGHSRSRGVLILAVAVTSATAFAFKFKADAIKRNEVDQRTEKAPNGYVSVDRSGGGI
ncbi:hypothetical protein PT974_00820 [Cladobotryum mycophilum]|uniref:Uncharacterized protein n=1 Tax=Cladobotryum mycophilum TaxID=491253 RepID=A0ABR0T1Y3_9HYPO